MSGGLRGIATPNFIKIGQSTKEILQFLDFSRWRPTPSWIFWNSQILLADGFRRSKMHHLAKFHWYRSVYWEDVTIFRFFMMAAVRHVGFVWGKFGPLTKVLDGLIIVQNLVAINAVFSKIWKFEFFSHFAWKRLFVSPKSGVGEFDPLNKQKYQQNPKRHILVRISIVRAIRRENPLTGLTCRWIPKKGYK